MLQFVDYWRPSVDLSEPFGIRRLKAACFSTCISQRAVLPLDSDVVSLLYLAGLVEGSDTEVPQFSATVDVFD